MSSTEDSRDEEAQGGVSSNDAFVEPPVRRSTYTPPTSPTGSAVDAGVPPIHDDDELAAALADDLSRTMTGSIPIVHADADVPLGDDPFASLFGTQDPPTAPTPVIPSRGAEPTEQPAAPAYEVPAFVPPPVIDEPPVFEIPVVEEPAAFSPPPVFEIPIIDDVIPPASASDFTWARPVDDAPAPVFEAPVSEAPAYEAPAFNPPIFEPPVFGEPIDEPAAFTLPDLDEPTAEAPVFEIPTYEAPASEAPSFETPVFDPPVFEAPAFEPPVFEAPASEPPAFHVPVPSASAAPVGEEPTPPPPFDPSMFAGPVVFPSAEEQAAQLASLSAHAAPAGKPWVPERRSLPDADLMQILQEATGTEGSLGAMQRLEEQMRLRQEEAQEYSDWEQSMLAVGTPEALAAVNDVRPQFTGIIPRTDDAPAPTAYEAPAAASAPSPEPPAFAPPAPEPSGSAAPAPFTEAAQPTVESAQPVAEFVAEDFAEAVRSIPAEESAASGETEQPEQPADPVEGWQPSAWEPPVDDWTPPAAEEPSGSSAEDSDDDVSNDSEQFAEPVGAFATGTTAETPEAVETPTSTESADTDEAPAPDVPSSIFGDSSPFAWAQAEPIIPPAPAEPAFAPSDAWTLDEDATPTGDAAPVEHATAAEDAAPTEDAAAAEPEPVDPFAELFATTPPAEQVTDDDVAPSVESATTEFWADPSASVQPEPAPVVPPTLVEPPETRGADQGIPAPWFVPQPPVVDAEPQPAEESLPSPADSLFAQALAAEQPSPFTVEEPPAPSQAEPSSATPVDSDAAASVRDEATTPSAPLDFDSLLGGGDPADPIFVEPRRFQSSESLPPQEEVAQPLAVEPEGVLPAAVDPELEAVLPATVVPEADQAPTAPDPAAVPEAVVTASSPARQRVFSPEASGVESTPADYRVGRAARLFWLWFAANSSIVSVAFGAVIFSLGMSLRQAIIATVAGVALSFLPLGLGTLAGKRSGQPTMVVSRATFGVIGNVVPALIGLLTRIFWGAALLWLLAASVAAILVGARVDGGLGYDLLVYIGLGAGFVLAVVIAYFGYALIAWLQLVVSIVSGILIVGIVALTWQYIDIPNALTTRDGSWILVATGAVLVFSFVGLVWANSSSDLARYQRPGSSGAASMLWAPLGTTVPTFLLIAYGALLAASNAQIAAGLIDNPLDTLGRLLPVWYPVPLIVVTALGLLSGVVVSIYSGGFALQSLGARMPRPVSALVTGVLLVALAFGLSVLELDLTALFRDVATTLAVPVAAWVGIFAAETMIRNRRYDTASLLSTGGVYPTVNWINLPALFIVTGIGFGLTTATIAGLDWQGYLFSVLGVDLSSDLAASDIGVLAALVLGLLVPIVAGIPAIRRQESSPGLAN